MAKINVNLDDSLKELIKLGADENLKDIATFQYKNLYNKVEGRFPTEEEVEEWLQEQLS